MTNHIADWWLNAKYGMFIHWGVYSHLGGQWKGQTVKGNSEWIMRRLEIPLKDYEEAARQFHPSAFHGEEWVKLAKDAGMKYIVFTAKHHDGFAMFKSEDSYNIMDASGYQKDPVAELAAACAKYGLRLCLYYSHVLDWHEEAAFQDDIPVDKMATVQEKNQRFRTYLEKKVKPQLKELLTNYGPIGAMWFDMPGCVDPCYCKEIRNYVKTLQPECIISGRLGYGYGDYTTMGDNKIPLLPCGQPWEMPGTINDTWGFKKGDRKWKTPEALLRSLIKIVSRGGNYLLNVGPDGNGRIPEESKRILLEVGKYLSQNAESVYGTTAIPPYPYDIEDGLFTAKKGFLYYHCFRRQERLSIYCIGSPVNSVTLLSTGESLSFHSTWSEAAQCHELVIELPADMPDDYGTVFKIETDNSWPVFEDIFLQEGIQAPENI